MMKDLNKKKYIIIIASIIAIFGITRFCYLTFLNQHKIQRASSVIPKDQSTFILVLNLKQIAEKANLMKILDRKVSKIKNNTHKNQNKIIERSNIFRKLAKNPTVTGIDYTSDFYIYHCYRKTNEHYLAISLPIQSKNSFTKFMKDLTTEFVSKSTSNRIKDIDGKKYLIDDEMGGSWDGNKFLLIYGINHLIGIKEQNDYKVEDYLRKLMTLKEDDQITNNNRFNNFYKNKKDVSLWMSTYVSKDNEKQILNNLKKRYPKEYKLFGFEIGMPVEEIIKISKDNLFITHVNFDYGKIEVNSKFIPNTHCKDFIQSNNLFDKRSNNKILSVLPESNILLISQNINLKNTLKFSKKYLDQEMKKAMIESSIKNSLDMSIDSIIDMFGGSFLFTLNGSRKIQVNKRNWQKTNFNQLPREYKSLWDEEWKEFNEEEDFTYQDTIIPLIGCVFDIDNHKILDTIIEKFTQKDTNNNYHTIENNGIPIYFSKNNELAIITNDKTYITNFTNLTNNLSSNDLNLIKDKTAYIRLSLNMNDYKSMLDDQMFTDDFIKILNLEVLENIEFYQKMDPKNSIFLSNLTINLKKKNKNSLESILKILKNNVSLQII